MSALGRYGADGNLQVYDGTNSYQTTSAFSGAIEAGVWMEIWMVIDHGNNTSTWYAKGGSFPTITKIYEDAGYRAETLSDLTDFIVRLNAGGTEAPGGSDDVYIDDLNIDLGGENLTTPSTVGAQEGAYWGGYLIDENGWVNTGDWLGWLHVGNAPFVYNDALATWMFMNEPSEGATGAWVYPFK